MSKKNLRRKWYLENEEQSVSCLSGQPAASIEDGRICGTNAHVECMEKTGEVSQIEEESVCNTVLARNWRNKR